MKLNIKKIKPMFNQVITTMEKYSDEDAKIGSIIDVSRVKNPIKEYQKVVAVGPMVKNIKAGDIVMINPRRYEVKKYEDGSIKNNIVAQNEIIKYNFNVIELDHIQHLLLSDNDIDFVIEEYEEEETPQSDIIVPNNDIILN